jgi:hypothetical protein
VEDGSKPRLLHSHQLLLGVAVDREGLRQNTHGLHIGEEP